MYLHCNTDLDHEQQSIYRQRGREMSTSQKYSVVSKGRFMKGIRFSDRNIVI